LEARKKIEYDFYEQIKLDLPGFMYQRYQKEKEGRRQDPKSRQVPFITLLYLLFNEYIDAKSS
jgi:hypothetical protein